jgi:alkylhydroperoxidase family enzyme
MPRIRSAHDVESLEELDPGTATNALVASILAHRPEIATALSRVGASLVKHSALPPRLTELVRLRIAFHNQCRSCMAVRYTSAIDDGLDEDLVCSLEAPHEAVDLTLAERAALRYADLFASDHLAIGDAVYDDLRRHFDEGEIVELGMHCAHYVGMGRLVATWQVTDLLPDRFRASEGPVTPWGGDELVIPARQK